MKKGNPLKGLISFGNTKLPKSTAIFNMNSAKECPSERLGLCPIAKVCYAKKAERMYPSAIPYRNRQSAFWRHCTAEEFASMILEINTTKRTKIKYLRISEAGDFESQKDVEKVEQIASALKQGGITTYTYTARKDLDYSFVRNLIVNGSGFRKEGIKHTFTAVRQFSGKIKCVGDCSKCNLCASTAELDIQVLLH